MPQSEFPRILTVDHSWYLAFQDSANEQQKADVREFANILQAEMVRRGYGVKTDEREEILIGAITRYLIQSQ